jgi:hypothetical protein
LGQGVLLTNRDREPSPPSHPARGVQFRIDQHAAKLSKKTGFLGRVAAQKQFVRTALKLDRREVKTTDRV